MLRNVFQSLYSASSSFHTSLAASSVFMKRQKKIDPEIAKQREIRKRRKLEKEIRAMQKHSKKPKPVDELSLDVHSAKNIQERHREAVVLTREQIDERVGTLKEFARSRSQLMILDDKNIRGSIARQNRALRELKAIGPDLYEKAIQPNLTALPLVIHGPALTPHIDGYEAPDGDYIDTTRKWS